MSHTTQDNKTEQEKVKLLLLGPGESGKSTIFRQMKLLYGVIPEEDRVNFVSDEISKYRYIKLPASERAVTLYGSTCPWAP